MQKRTADTTHIEAQAPDTKMILDSIIRTARVNSLYTNNVNWEELEKEMFNKLIDNDSLSSLEEPIRYMMTSLGDFHPDNPTGGETINKAILWINSALPEIIKFSY